MNSIPCDIVLLPGADLSQKAISVSEQLKEYGSRFTLRPDSYVPHLSLYMAQIKQGDLEKVKAALAGIAVAPPVGLVAARYYQSHGYIDVEYARHAAIDALQMAVIRAINPLRDGLLRSDEARAQQATGKIKENFMAYGYPGVGDLFRPHLTFTRFVSDTIISIEALPPLPEFNGLFTKLGLFVMDEDGACVRKLAEFTLEGAA